MRKVVKVISTILFCIALIGIIVGFCVMLGAESQTEMAKFDCQLLAGLGLFVVSVIITFLSYKVCGWMTEQRKDEYWEVFEQLESVMKSKETKTTSHAPTKAQ